MDNKGIDLRATLARTGNSLARAGDPKVRKVMADNAVAGMLWAADRKVDRARADAEQAGKDKATLLKMAEDGKPRPRLNAKDPEERRLARRLRAFTKRGQS
jgi:hypothetical protein